MITSDSSAKRSVPIDFDGGPDTMLLPEPVPVMTPSGEMPDPLAALEQPADVGRGIRAVLLWVAIGVGFGSVLLIALKVGLQWAR